MRKFVFGPGIDEPVILEDVAARYYYHADSLGSTIALSNDSGAYTETYAYSSWGQVVTGSSVGNPYLYTGRRLDPETGIYYYRNRYYDANLRRFLQADPIGFAGGMNLYAYVGNNPSNFIDPNGLSGYRWRSSFRRGLRGGIQFIRNPYAHRQAEYYLRAIRREFPHHCMLMNARPYGYGRRDVETFRNQLNRLRIQRDIDLWNVGIRSLGLGRGSTIDPSAGRYEPSDLREMYAILEAWSNPTAGTRVPVQMGDSRWPSSAGWQKMQITIESGGRKGEITVHYNYNTRTKAVDDFKITRRKDFFLPPDPKMPPIGD